MDASNAFGTSLLPTVDDGEEAPWNEGAEAAEDDGAACCPTPPPVECAPAVLGGDDMFWELVLAAAAVDAVDAVEGWFGCLPEIESLLSRGDFWAGIPAYPRLTGSGGTNALERDLCCLVIVSGGKA